MYNFYHPKMQEVLIQAAAVAGAEVRRGAVITDVRQGSQPTVSYQGDGLSHEVQGRLVVGADGRISATRKWTGFSIERDPPSLMLAGMLFDNMPVPDRYRIPPGEPDAV